MNQSLEQMARRRLSGLSRGYNRIYRVPAVSSAITAGNSSSPLNVRFRKRGIVVACYGQVSDALDATAATTEFRLQIAGTRDIITDGDSGTFMPFLAAFGKAQNWFPIDLPAVEGQDWTTTYRVVSGGTSTTPSLMFAVLEDAD